MIKKLLFALLAASTLQVYAKGTMTIDLSAGSATITPQTITVGGSDPVATTNYSSFRITTSSETTNGLIITGVAEGSPLDIIFDSVNINRSGVKDGGHEACSPVIIQSGYVRFYITGESTLRAGFDSAGLELHADAILEISEMYGLEKGVLRSYGGSYIGGTGGGAGIGASVYGSCGTLILNSGTLYAEGCKGGAGFGSGWEYTPNSSQSGGKFIQNGGEAHLRGSSAGRNGNCPEGVGSVNAATTVELNGGIFDSTIRTSSAVTVDGVRATAATLDGMTPNATYTLYNMLGQDEVSVSADGNGNFTYWLIDNGQTFDDLAGNREVVQAYTEPRGHGTVRGGGLYAAGSEVEFGYAPKDYDVYDFDGWSGGIESTENPATLTVQSGTTVLAEVSPKVDRMWRAWPMRETEGECYVMEFNGSLYTGTTLDVPASFIIDGDSCTTVCLGEPEMDMIEIWTSAPIAELTLPAGLRLISPMIFDRLSSLTSVTVNAVTPPSLIRDSDRFYTVPENCVLKVPYGTSELYRAAPGWKEFSAIEEMPNPCVVIDVAQGSVAITPEGYTVNGTFYPHTLKYELFTSATTDNGVTISGGTEKTPIQIAINGIDIDRSAISGEHAECGGITVISGYADLTLKGESTVRGGKETPGLFIPTESTVSINGDGSLTAFGGSEITGGEGSAGIGACAGGGVGTLIINSGTVIGYGCRGGAGFGSGSNHTMSGRTPGGRFVINGGEATFVGTESATDGFSTLQGLGSYNMPTTIEINGGTLHTTIHPSSEVWYMGKQTQRVRQRGVTRGAAYVLNNMLGMEEYLAEVSSLNIYMPYFTYWLTEGQTLRDLIGDRVLVLGLTDPSDLDPVSGGGIYERGTEVEFSFVHTDYSHWYGFDHWDNGSTDMPLRIVVDSDTTLTAILTPQVKYMWHGYRMEGTDGECYIDRFDGMVYEETSLEVPSSYDIEGVPHTVTTFGHPEYGSMMFDIQNPIEEITLPSTLRSIGAYALHIRDMHGMTDGNALRTVISHAAVPPTLVGGDSFFEVPENCVLKVPQGSAEAYQAAPGWKDFFAIQETTSINEIGGSADFEAVYYDSRGIMVGSDIHALTPGLYFERRGPITRKLVIGN